MNRYSLGQMAIAAIIILALIAIVYIAAQAMGVPIPPWVLHVLGVVFVAVVCVLAIKFISGAGGPPAA